MRYFFEMVGRRTCFPVFRRFGGLCIHLSCRSIIQECCPSYCAQIVEFIKGLRLFGRSSEFVAATHFQISKRAETAAD